MGTNKEHVADLVNLYITGNDTSTARTLIELAIFMRISLLNNFRADLRQTGPHLVPVPVTNRRTCWEAIVWCSANTRDGWAYSRETAIDIFRFLDADDAALFKTFFV